MKKLIEGIVDFRQKLTDESRTLFAKLDLGASPDALFIACSDSRVVPNFFSSTNPGYLFVLRNIGNLIPPSSPSICDDSASAVLEYSVFTLNVTDIIVCGHSECGAMLALSREINSSCCPHLLSWLKYGKNSLDKMTNNAALFDDLILDKQLALHNQLSQVNVLQQMEHVMTYSFVKERVAAKQLRIHGWWFDIAKADVYCYERALRQFVLIDENEAKDILKRMDGE